MNINPVMVQRGKKTLDNVITEYLIKSNFKRDIRGFVYLREAIKICYHDNKMLINTMDIYKRISKSYEVNYTNIERCIRHAIERAEHSTYNSEFMRSAADDIRLTYREVESWPFNWKKPSEADKKEAAEAATIKQENNQY